MTEKMKTRKPVIAMLAAALLAACTAPPASVPTAAPAATEVATGTATEAAPAMTEAPAGGESKITTWYYYDQNNTDPQANERVGNAYIAKTIPLFNEASKANSHGITCRATTTWCSIW